MEDLEFWDEVEGIGKLNMEMELVVAEEPILFVCSLEDNPEKKYLIMTYNSFKGKYVIREINNQELLLMLENEVTMEQTFRNGKEIIVTYLKDGMLHAQTCSSSDFSESMLPKKGAYYNIHSKYILDYIDTLKEKKYSINFKVWAGQYFEYDSKNNDLWNTPLKDAKENQNSYTWTFDTCEYYEYQAAPMETYNAEIDIKASRAA